MPQEMVISASMERGDFIASETILSLMFFVTDQSESGRISDKHLDVAGHIGGDIRCGFPDFAHDVIKGVMTVKLFPDQNANRVETKGVARIRIEEDRPIIKFFPKNDQGIRDDVFFIRFIHDECTLSFVLVC